jgi:GAF domain-containing protein
LINVMEASMSQFESLAVLYRRVRACSSIEGVISFVGSEIPSLLDVDQARLYMIRYKGNQGYLWTLGPGFEGDITEAPIGTGLVGEAAMSGVMVNTSAGRLDLQRVPSMSAPMTATLTRSPPGRPSGSGAESPGSRSPMICVPITRRSGAAMAVLQCIRGPEGFDCHDETLLQLAAQHLGVELENIQLAKAVESHRAHALRRVLQGGGRRRLAGCFGRWSTHARVVSATEKVQLEKRAEEREHEARMASERAEMRSATEAILEAAREMQKAYATGREEDLKAVFVGKVTKLMKATRVWLELPGEAARGLPGGAPPDGDVDEQVVEEFRFKHYGLDGSPREGIMKIQIRGGSQGVEMEQRLAVRLLVQVFSGWLSSFRGKREVSDQVELYTRDSTVALKELSTIKASMRCMLACLKAPSHERLLEVVSREVKDAVGAKSMQLYLIEEDEAGEWVWTYESSAARADTDRLLQLLAEKESAREGDAWERRPKEGTRRQAVLRILKDALLGVEDQEDGEFQVLPIFDNGESRAARGLLAVLVWSGPPLGQGPDEGALLGSVLGSGVMQLRQVRLNKTMSALTEKVGHMERELGESRSALDSSQAKYSTLTAQLEDNERRADALEAELRRLQSQYMAEKERLENEVSALQGELQADRDKLSNRGEESGRLNGEVLSLHEQVFRQQAEMNELTQKLEERTAVGQTNALILDAAEKLLSVQEWDAVRKMISTVMGFLLSFDRLEYRLRASSLDLGGITFDEMVITGEAELFSSSEAASSALLQQVMLSGSAAVRQMKVSDVGSAGEEPYLSLCIPLVAERTKRVVGSLLLERRGQEARFSDRDMLAVTKLSPFLSNVLQRACREQIIRQHTRNSSMSQKALRMLSEAEEMWRNAGTLSALSETFERGLQNLLLMGRDEDACAVRCTLFMVDPVHQLLKGTNREMIPFGVGTVGMVAVSGKAARESHLLYVPVVDPTGGPSAPASCLGVVRVHFLRRQNGAEPGPTDLHATDEDVYLVNLFCRILVPVIHQAHTMKSAFEGMKDASNAIRGLQAKLQDAQNEASIEVTSRVRTEEILGALERLHIGCRTDSLVTLFRSAEVAAKTACNGEIGALLLLVNEGEIDASNVEHLAASNKELWTLWPSAVDSGDRARVRVLQEACTAELFALSRASPVVISPPNVKQGQFTLHQCWTYAVAVGPQVHSDDVTALIVPVARPAGGGMYGVIEVLKKGPLDGSEEAALAAVARELTTFLGWYHAELLCQRLKTDMASLNLAVDEHSDVVAIARRDTDCTRSFADMALRMLEASDPPNAALCVQEHLRRIFGAPSEASIRVK